MSSNQSMLVGPPPYSLPSPSLTASCSAAVTHLLSSSINFLALDFDLTILSVHTGGAWPGTPEELSRHVRPVFYRLIEAALEANLAVAVVTFSPQVREKEKKRKREKEVWREGERERGEKKGERTLPATPTNPPNFL